MKGFNPEKEGRSSILWFDIGLTEFYCDWKGKLIPRWPPPERSWWRRAHKKVMPVHAIIEESALDAAMLKSRLLMRNSVPGRIESSTFQWRGIYFIFDVSDGNGYVGSAYGEENLLGRWVNYAASGHGGKQSTSETRSKELSIHAPTAVSPDVEADEVISLESTQGQGIRREEDEQSLDEVYAVAGAAGNKYSANYQSLVSTSEGTHLGHAHDDQMQTARSRQPASEPRR